MRKKQFQHKILRSFYKPKRSKFKGISLGNDAFKSLDEIDLYLDKKIGRLTGTRTRKPAKKDDDKKED